jgi:hypothetical protein
VSAGHSPWTSVKQASGVQSRRYGVEISVGGALEGTGSSPSPPSIAAAVETSGGSASSITQELVCSRVSVLAA